MTSALEQCLAQSGLTGWIHARDLDSGRTVGVRADEPVVAASVFKIPVLIELCCQVSEGRLDPHRRIRLEPDDFPVPGGTGISLFRDAVELSLLDLSVLMMSVSDNRATDVVIDAVGLAQVNSRMRAAGLVGTYLEADCAGLFRQIDEDLGEPWDDYLRRDPTGARLRVVRAATPELTNRTTAEETTALLGLVWADEMFPADACAEVRHVLGVQAFTHRLAAGFPEPTTRVWGKTGTLAHVRNEAGVVELEDGRRVAVAVFLDCLSPDSRNPDADRLIGTLARLAVDALA